MYQDQSLKKVWLTSRGSVFSLTLEAALLDPPSVSARELTFPLDPTPEKPQRHTVVIGMLTDDDARMIIKELTAYLTS